MGISTKQEIEEYLSMESSSEDSSSGGSSSNEQESKLSQGTLDEKCTRLVCLSEERLKRVRCLENSIALILRLHEEGKKNGHPTRLPSTLRMNFPARRTVTRLPYRDTAASWTGRDRTLPSGGGPGQGWPPAAGS
eukprot:767569-Hanusia_phi.AAC.1